MGWVRVDDAFYDHGKFAEAGPLGMALWLAGLAYCNRNLTDGKIPRSVARRLIDLDGLHWRAWDGELIGGCESVDALDLARHLVGAGLWEDMPGGYKVHDYHDYQPSAADVRAERERNAIRKAAWRAKARPKGSHTGTTPETDTVTPRDVTPAPNPNPNPRTKTTPFAGANARFSEFYEPYPRKENRAKALEAWIKLTKTIDPQLIIDGVPRYVEHIKRTRTEREHIAHPTTWLNGHRWEDDYATELASVAAWDV